MALNKLVVF